MKKKRKGIKNKKNKSSDLEDIIKVGSFSNTEYNLNSGTDLTNNPKEKSYNEYIIKKGRSNSYPTIT